MSWQDQLNGDSLAWVLEDEAPEVRALALRDLQDRGPDDRELRAARKAALRPGKITSVLDQMDPAGFWVEPGPGYNPKYRSTVWSIILLAQLGATLEADKRIATACKYLMEHTLMDGGQFTASGAPSGTADCLQGNLCRAFMELGFSDPRLETAYDWMARSVTGEGIASMGDRTAKVRYYAGKCGPNFACGANNKLPCAWGAAKVMLALGKVPQRTANARYKPRHRARGGLLFQQRPCQGNLSFRVEQQTQPELVEIRIPGLLRDRPAPDR